MTVFVLTGPSGSGKSAIAAAVAARLGVPYTEADDYHTDSNKAKMRAGEPLTDADRLPWLLTLHRAIAYWIAEARNAIVTCSALKRSYRNLLLTGTTEPPTSCVRDSVLFVHLSVSRDALLSRAASRAARSEHFFPPTLVDSQLAILEPPDPEAETAVWVNGDLPELEVLDAVTDIVRLRLT